MVRTQFNAKLKHHTLDTLIAVGHWASSFDKHNHVELFTLSSSKWLIKKDYPYFMDIHAHSILAFEKKFIIFGGRCSEKQVFKIKTNNS